jgi:hypothetical protein
MADDVGMNEEERMGEEYARSIGVVLAEGILDDEIGPAHRCNKATPVRIIFFGMAGEYRCIGDV